MADVALLLPASPEHVRTARLVVVAAARRAGLDDGLIDEVRFAVGEACARAVGLHRRDALHERILVTVSDELGGLVVSVADQGATGAPAADLAAGLLDHQAADGSSADLDAVDPNLSLALLNGLVDGLDVAAGPDGSGTVVTLRWPLPPRLVSGPPSTAAART